MEHKNDLFRELISLFSRVSHKFQQLETQPCNFGDNCKLYSAEIHLIEAIGKKGEISVTELSKCMGVTLSAISQKLSKLEKMNLIKKSQIVYDKRNKNITLTEMGKKAFNEHNKFHKSFFDTFSKSKVKESPDDILLFNQTLLQLEKSIDEIIKNKG